MGKGHSTRRCQPTLSTQTTPVSSNTQDSTVILVWYDPNMNSVNSNSKYKQTKALLSEITDNMQLHTVEAQFLRYMERSERNSVVLILSGHVARDILPRVNHLKHVKSVHIYCDDKSLYQSLKTDFSKVKSISDERHELRMALEPILTHHDVFRYYNSVTQTSTWDLTTRNIEFKWLQLVQRLVLLEQTVHTNESKHDFIQRCREYCGDGYEPYQRYIDYLENDYRPKNAINEYAKVNFLHSLINRAIRTGDIEELYRFRYFIAHLCENLAKQSDRFRRQRQRHGDTVLKLYRGQQLSQKEGEQLRTSGNKYIAMRSFLSTTWSREVAEIYAGSPSEENFAVLFEITVDLDQVPSIVLADISRFRQVEDEKEVLFSLNTIFEIDKQLRDDCGRWIIRMHATNFGEKIVSDYVRHRQSETSNCSSLSTISIKLMLAQLLIEMGQYVEAEKFLENISATTDDERANKYFILADAEISSHCSVEHALDKAIQLLEDSRELFRSLDNTLGIANTRRRHADALVINEKYDDAILIYEEAIRAYRIVSEHHESIASCYNGLADVYLGQQEYERARVLYTKALNRRETHLPPEHPAIALSYYSLGRYYHYRGNNHQNARKNLIEALKRKKQIYPPNHPSIQRNELLLEEVEAAFPR